MIRSTVGLHVLKVPQGSGDHEGPEGESNPPCTNLEK